MTVLRGHADLIESISILEDESDQLRILTGSRDKSVRIWNPRFETADVSDTEDRVAREVFALRKHTRGVTAVDCTRAGDLIVTASRDGRLLLWPAR